MPNSPPCSAHPAQAEVEERLVCHASAGGNARADRKAFDIGVRASVATPLLDFSSRSLSFHHAYARGAPILPITRPLTLRNISKLPLAFSLRCAPPFSIDKGELALAPFEYATINVTYEPNPPCDLVSSTSKQKLQVGGCCVYVCVRVRMCVAAAWWRGPRLAGAAVLQPPHPV